MSDEMQTTLKNSRDEVLKLFDIKYNAKRTNKGTQGSHLDNLNQQQNGVVSLEIQYVDISKLKYDKEWVNSKPKSAWKPRKALLPRTFTPPKNNIKTDYHAELGRNCLTNSEKSFTSPSVVRENNDDKIMHNRTLAKQEIER